MRADGPGLNGARRIAFYGVTGSGKTTLAARLSELTGIPWHEGDAIGWLPGWVKRDIEEQRELAARVCAQEAWIFDTAWGDWRDLVMERVQLVVALDLPRAVSLSRLVRRSVSRAVDGREICNGNVESWRVMFSRESILLWHFRNFEAKRGAIDAFERDAAGPPVRRLRRRDEVESWFDEVRLELERAG